MGVSSYYNFARLFSFNATWMSCTGGRGLGKTFGAKKKATNDALAAVEFVERKVTTQRRNKDVEQLVIEATDCENQFIYLRRYKEELALAKATFFADYEYLYPDWDFRVHGWEAQASPRKYADMERKRPWACIGYFVALSVAQNYKSVQFPRVKIIIFDEYIAERGVQYLPNEPAKLTNFYNTVDRSKDKTRVLMLANSVEITNPYFIKYKVQPEKADKDGFIKMASGYQIWHFPEAKDFQSEVMQTKFGRFILETDPEYAAFAVSNEFSDNHNSLVESKGYKAAYLFTLETKLGIYSIWYNMQTDKYYVQGKRPRSDEDVVTIEPSLMAENKRLMTLNDKPLQMLRTAYRHDRMRFDGAPARNALMEIFKR